MRLSLVFYVFLTRTAIAGFIALVPLWFMRPAERHVRFSIVMSFVLAAGSAALYLPALGDSHPDWPHGISAFLSLEGGMPGFLIISCVFALLANFAFGTFKRRAGRILLSLAILFGLGAIWGTTRFSPYAASSLGAASALFVSGLLGGLVMASINDAMVLGHFYLMIKGLPLEALKRSARFVAVVLIARIVWFGLVLLFWDGASEVLLGTGGVVWTAWRIAFGFFGPLTLLWMVKDTVRLQHTQAATGLLYVAVGFAIMGELAAVYLEMSTGIPA